VPGRVHEQVQGQEVRQRGTAHRVAREKVTGTFPSHSRRAKSPPREVAQ
jgi:hypothetical protein